ncbi:hypothetical protein MKW92_052794, partial [Papaver armeniacum]
TYAHIIARRFDEDRSELYKEQQRRKLEKKNSNLEAEVDVNLRDRDDAVIVQRRKFPETFRGKEYKKQVIAEIVANYPRRVYEGGDPKEGVETVEAMW